MASLEVLEQVCENCNQEYCSLREILSHLKKPVHQCGHLYEGHETCQNLLDIVRYNLSDRLLFQFKCIEELKWIKSDELKRNLSWNEATQMWIDEGFAAKFADIYRSGVRDIYFFYRAGTVPKRNNSHCIRPSIFQRVIDERYPLPNAASA
jgi:hypothetical protein